MRLLPNSTNFVFWTSIGAKWLEMTKVTCLIQTMGDKNILYSAPCYFGVPILGENLEHNPNYDEEMYELGFYDKTSWMGVVVDDEEDMMARKFVVFSVFATLHLGLSSPWLGFKVFTGVQCWGAYLWTFTTGGLECKATLFLFTYTTLTMLLLVLNYTFGKGIADM